MNTRSYKRIDQKCSCTDHREIEWISNWRELIAYFVGQRDRSRAPTRKQREAVAGLRCQSEREIKRSDRAVPVSLLSLGDMSRAVAVVHSKRLTLKCPVACGHVTVLRWK